MLLLCPDCPTGKWSEREVAAQQVIRSASISGAVVDVPGVVSADKCAGTESPVSDDLKKEGHIDIEAQTPDTEVAEVQGETIQKPTFNEAMHIVFSLQTFVTGACYFNSFGAELAINSILGNYYTKNFPKLGLQGTGNWAAIFGFLNVVFRPLGGAAADFAYQRTGSAWSKKILLHAYGVLQGASLIALALTDSHNKSTMFGLVSGMTFFLEGGSGLNYAPRASRAPLCQRYRVRVHGRVRELWGNYLRYHLPVQRHQLC